MISESTINQLVERIKQFDPEMPILIGSYANGWLGNIFPLRPLRLCEK